jgi:hypothetical protein
MSENLKEKAQEVVKASRTYYRSILVFTFFLYLANGLFLYFGVMFLI